MEKRNKRPEDERNKESGDSRKGIIKATTFLENKENIVNTNAAERGDLIKVYTQDNRAKGIVMKDPRRDSPPRRMNEKVENNNKVIETGYKQRIRERYTIKPNALQKTNTDAASSSERSTDSKTDDDTDALTKLQRRPVIKAIMSKNETLETMRIFKTVKFEEKPIQPRRLKINIPNGPQKRTKTSTTNTIFTSTTKGQVFTPLQKQKNEVRVNRTSAGRRKKLTVKKKVKVKEISESSEDDSPTEAVKLAPSSINHHTKPYYEAWVDTTLAAISRNSKRDKLFYLKSDVINKFQRTLDNYPVTPVAESIDDDTFGALTEPRDLYDERYTGRIRVRTR